MASARFDPKQEMKGMWGIYTAGLTWRYYGAQRFVGGFGIDLEFLQQGFSFATNASLVEEPKDFRYYTRHINSVMLPIVWQPHVYILRHRVRVYLEAAATFSYQLSSDYEDESAKASGMTDWKGDYNYKTARDSRWGYGLAGGGGISFLIRRFEINVRAVITSGFRTSSATAINMRTTASTVPKTRSGLHPCVRRWTTSPFRWG